MRNCNDTIDGDLRIRIKEIELLCRIGKDEYIYDYGAGFRFVKESPPDSMNPKGYFEWRLSNGEPSDEFRIYTSRDTENNLKVRLVKYVCWQEIEDRIDTAYRVLRDYNELVIKLVFDHFFVKTGLAEKALKEN